MFYFLVEQIQIRNLSFRPFQKWVLFLGFTLILIFQIVFEVLIFSRFIIDQEFFEGLLRVFKPEIAVDLEPVEVFGGLFLDVFKVVGDRRHDVFDVEVIS